MIIELDMYQTLAIAVVVLMLGKFLRKKCSLLEKFCIPAPVVGGVLLPCSPACAMRPALWSLHLMIS